MLRFILEIVYFVCLLNLSGMLMSLSHVFRYVDGKLRLESLLFYEKIVACEIVSYFFWLVVFQFSYVLVHELGKVTIPAKKIKIKI